MSWQLSCRDMCKFVTWLVWQNYTYKKEHFQLWTHKPFVKCFPVSISYDLEVPRDISTTKWQEKYICGLAILWVMWHANCNIDVNMIRNNLFLFQSISWLYGGDQIACNWDYCSKNDWLICLCWPTGSWTGPWLVWLWTQGSTYFIAQWPGAKLWVKQVDFCNMFF